MTCVVTGVAVLWGLALAVNRWLGHRHRSRLAGRARSLLGVRAGHPGAGGIAHRALSDLMAIPIRRPWHIPALLLLPLGLALGEYTHSVVPLLGAAAGVVPLHRWRSRRRLSTEAGLRAAAVIELCAGLAAELRSGATSEHALQTVISRAGTSLEAGLGTEPVARLAAARYGADVPAALRFAAELPGGRGAAAVAACWRVTTESGTGLAAGLDQVADALRAERALAEEIAGELAGPRTTVALLAALPLVGTLLGTALGAQPVQVLLHTPTGLACLLGGVLLEAAGLAWTSRIVRAAGDAPERQSPVGRAAARPPTGEPVTDRSSGCGISRTRLGRTGVTP